MTDQQILLERKKIADQLKSLRVEHGYTQDDVAKAMGVTHDTISKIEAAKWNFGIDTVIKYTGVFKSKAKFV